MDSTQLSLKIESEKGLPGLHPGLNDLIRVLGKQAHCASRTLIVCEPTSYKTYSQSKYHKNCGSPKKGQSLDSLCRPSSLWSPIPPESYYYDCFFYRQYPDRDAEYKEIEAKYNAIKQEKLDYSPPECQEERNKSAVGGKSSIKSRGANITWNRYDEGSNSSSGRLVQGRNQDGVIGGLLSTRVNEDKPSEPSLGSLRNQLKPPGSGSNKNIMSEGGSVPCSELAEIRDLLKISDRETLRRLQEMLTLMKELSVRDICRATCADGRFQAENEVPSDSEHRETKGLYSQRGHTSQQSRNPDYHLAEGIEKNHQQKGGDYGSQGSTTHYGGSVEGYFEKEDIGPQGSRSLVQDSDSNRKTGKHVASHDIANTKVRPIERGYSQHTFSKRTDGDDYKNAESFGSSHAREPRSFQQSVTNRKRLGGKESDNSHDPSLSSTSSESGKSSRSRTKKPPSSGGEGEYNVTSDSDLTESSCSSLYSASSTTDASRKGYVNESDSHCSEEEPEVQPISAVPLSQEDGNKNTMKQRPNQSRLPGSTLKTPLGRKNVPSTVPEVVELSNKITDVIVKEVIDELIKQGLYYPPSSRYSHEQEASKTTLNQRHKLLRTDLSVPPVGKEMIRDSQNEPTSLTSRLSRIDEFAGYSKMPPKKVGEVFKDIKREDKRHAEASQSLNPPTHSKSIILSPTTSSRRRSSSCRLGAERRTRSEGDHQQESTQQRDERPPEPWERRLSSQLIANSMRDSSGAPTQTESPRGSMVSKEQKVANQHKSTTQRANNIPMSDLSSGGARNKFATMAEPEQPEQRPGTSHPTAITTEYCEPDDLTATDYDTDSSFLYYARITNKAFPPIKETFHSAGFMLRSAYNYEIPPRSKMSIKTDLLLLLPRNSYGRIAPRKCLVENYGIDVVADVIDRDYKGNVTVVLYNHSDRTIAIERGNKVAQLICESVHLAKVVEKCDLIK